ncbi:MAG: O-antigen ligase family protein [Minisyncoccia bacterium]
MLIQAIIVIIQFILQKNIGLPIVVESVLSTQISGVAKVNIFDNTLIRGYGTFPHPNILGFSGILALIILYATKLGKGVSMMIYSFTLILAGGIDHYIVTSVQAFSITIFTGLQLVYGNYIKLIKPFSRVLVLALHILILLSFSKTALTLLLLIDFIYLTFVARKSLFHVEQFQKKLKSIPRIINNTLAIIGIMFLWILPYQQILDTIATRILYVKDSVQIISSNLWFGVGLGQYVVNLSDNRELWQYEPVHNIFLLLLSELGLINFSLLVVVISVEYYTYIYGYKK